ncbi:MAG TPA: dihydrodipicolinate synthase family protein [Chitinophagaceae bacterium]|nr:dihydrodipicolinate synthase family protein [Chitinophagaceae bacterium]
MNPLKSNEIFGNWATLLLPIDEKDQIDYKSLEQEIDILISMGVNGIYSNGTAGEFYNQTEEEFDKVSLILADKCNTAGMPFQIGCNHMSPVITLERLRRVISLKPGAVQVILPDWFPPVMDEIIDFLKRLIELARPVGIILYNPPHAKRKLQPQDFEKISQAGVQLTGCKLAGGDEDWYHNMKKYAPDLSLFIPGHQLATGISSGAHGAYSNVACLHPGAAQRWYALMKEDMESALEMQARIQLFMNDYIVPFIRDKKYSNQAADKFMAAVGGWMNIQPRLRWPYQWIKEEEVKQTRLIAKKILPEFFNN